MTVDTQPPPEAVDAPRRHSRVRLASRTLGELFVTAGVVLLLFVVYQLVWTNVRAGQVAQQQVQQLERQWDRPPDPQPSGARPPGPEYDRPLPNGEAFAIMYIPRLGADWREPVVQGVSLDDLARGVGHYPATALPGRVGNFAVAGHRATNGQPFAYLDRLRAGDVVVVETRTRWYTYTMDDGFIVHPYRWDVIDPVPSRPGATPTQRLITLTTCNPRWASYQRLIFHGVLTDVRPRSQGRPPALEG